LGELAWIWGGLAQYKPNYEPDFSSPVSLIIAARDEEENLKKHLKLWLSQYHKSYEVVVVNDCSDDGTEFLLAEYQRKYPHLHVINLKESHVFKGGKKYALTLGIKGAQFERVVFTDADCVPNSEYWLGCMNAQFIADKSIVLGMGQYFKEKGLLNYLIRMDTVQIAIQYLGLAARSYPYMGVGRNLAYTKEVFFENSGFRKHHAIKWGDDDLFINQVASGENTGLCPIPEAMTMSYSKKSFTSWFAQKRRHMSTSGKYNSWTKVLIAIKPIRILLYYSFLFLGLFQEELKISFLISASIIYLTHALIFIVLKKKIGEVEWAGIFPITELVLFIINTLIYISIWLKKPTKWI
jgi:glycosyltransferase involved in cell wall biosynthesis